MINSAMTSPQTIVSVVTTLACLLLLLPSQGQGQSQGLSRNDLNSLKAYFGCPPCNPSACPPPSRPGCELTKESGVCGCCLRCALGQGHRCGMYTDRCGKGLRCLPPTSGPDGLSALFSGLGTCERTTDQRE